MSPESTYCSFGEDLLYSSSIQRMISLLYGGEWNEIQFNLKDETVTDICIIKHSGMRLETCSVLDNLN